MSDAGELEYPVVNPLFVPVVTSPDEIEFRTGVWNGPSYGIRDESGEGQLPALLELLDGEHHVDEVLAEFETEAAEITETLVQLYRANIVVDAASLPSRAAQTTAGYLRLHDDAHDAAAVEDASVAIVADGAAGGYLATDLADAPVGDVQLLEYGDGVPTTPSADRSLGGERSPGVERSPGDDDRLDAAIEEADFVVAVAESPRPDLFERVNRRAIETGTPWLHAQVFGYDAILGPTVYPGQTPCYDCLRERVEATGDGELSLPSQADVRGAGQHLPAASHLAAGFLETELLHQLSDGVGFLLGRAVTVNLFDLSLNASAVSRRPRCDTCGVAPGADGQPFVSLDRLVGDGSDQFGSGGDDRFGGGGDGRLGGSGDSEGGGNR